AARFRADAVLCTQFLPAEVFALLRRRGAIPVPVYCAITDFAVHPIWVYPGIDRYFVASEFSAEQLRSTGVVAADRIEVTGVPIDPEFASQVGMEAARQELGLDLDPRRLTLLLMGGGFGWGPMESMLQVVLELSDRVHRILEAADLLVGKAGGLTSSEAMARGVPIIAVRPIPGQEERNVDYLQESGAAVRAYDLDDLQYRLMHFLSDRADLERMKANARSIGRPRSAFQVAESILTRLTP
ncbi:MAG: glycosyltransferase, partial [Candidatus Eisenbacteria bacterium]